MTIEGVDSLLPGNVLVPPLCRLMCIAVITIARLAKADADSSSTVILIAFGFGLSIFVLV